MTALVEREVKRTISDVSRFSTGLPGLKTHEASGQYLAEFDDVVGSLVGHVGDQTDRGISENLQSPFSA